MANVFSNKWNFHNTLGTVDGKHVAIRCPSKAGSTYYNYKQFHSIILMALVDAGYSFIFVYIGANGSCADNRIFEESGLPEAPKNTINIPTPKPQPLYYHPIPYSVIGDDAFPLSLWSLKPYPSRGLAT